MKTKAQTRATDGKYEHAMDRVCKCGARKGEHMAARPYDLDDTNCAGFRAARK